MQRLGLVIAMTLLACQGQKPTIAIIAAPAGTVKAADSILLTFSVDQASRYVVRLLGAGGTLVARGDAAGNEPVTISLAASALAAGEHILRLEVINEAAASDSASFTISRVLEETPAQEAPAPETPVVVTPVCAATDLALAVVPPPLTALHYGSHDTGARTLTFTHAGDSAQCSHDGGAHFAACDTASSLVFSADDYSLGRELVIRVARGSACAAEFRFAPKPVHPSLTFHTCEVVVTADETLTTLAARLDAPSRTVCVAAGVTFSPPTPEAYGIGITHPGVKLLGVEAAPLQLQLMNASGFYVGVVGVSAEFVVAHADIHMVAGIGQRVLHATETAGVVFTHVLIDTLTSLSTSLVLDQSDKPTPLVFHRTTMNIAGDDVPILTDGSIRIEESSMTTAGKVIISGSGDQKLELLRSTFSLAAGPSGAIFDDFSTHGPAPALELVLTDSTIENGDGPALLLDYDTVATITRSTLTGAGAGATLQIRQAVVTLNQAVVRTESDGISIEKRNGFASSLRLSGSYIRRRDSAPSGGFALTLANGPVLDFSGIQPNLFCQEGAVAFAALVSGAPGSGSYLLTTHHNQTPVPCLQ